MPGCSVEERLRRLVLNYLCCDRSDDHWPPRSPSPGMYKESLFNYINYFAAKYLGSDNRDSDPQEPETDDSFDSTASGTSSTTSSLSVDMNSPASDSEEDSNDWPNHRPPGPVCPVHFLTLDEYRALVGDHEFAIDTDFGWISEPSPTP